MTAEILPIPPVPGGVREAAQRGTLIPFVGAGASRLAGCPSWTDLADRALQCLIVQGKFSHGQLAQLNYLSPRVKLSIALGLQEEHGGCINFAGILHPDGQLKNTNGRRLYVSLSKLGKIFVTTNYDRWLDEEIAPPPLKIEDQDHPQPEVALPSPRSVVYRVEEMIPALLEQPNTVIHLHGSLRDPKRMIMTTQDYVRHYANDRMGAGVAEEENRVLTFLEALFRNRTVLFVGYGLEELEILEYVILKARRMLGDESLEARHYLLQGFFSHEYELMRSLQRYYLRECGIELVPFLRDQKDWEQLIDVLEDFSGQVSASGPMQLQVRSDMEDFLNG